VSFDDSKKSSESKEGWQNAKKPWKGKKH
jgi:hypothetical protein